MRPLERNRAWRAALLAALVALNSPFADAATTLKEPKTGLEFPGDTVFNGRRYEVARTSNLPSRVLGIGTWAAAVAYYVEAGSRASGSASAPLLAGERPALMVLAFVRPVPAQALRDLLRPEIVSRMKPPEADASRRDIDAVLFGIDDMKRGEVIQFVWLPEGDLEMLVKGTTRVRVTNAALARALWSLFLV